MKAIGLVSGGLDSRLAVRMIAAQGIEVVGLNFSSVFCTCGTFPRCAGHAKELSEALGVPVETADHTPRLLGLVRRPPHGYGRNMNPCVDCHAEMVRAAAARMREIGAAFLFTGEVLGQRPMSQHRGSLDIVAKEAGVEGLLLRPLSARLLDETVPEKEAWVSREKLAAIRGRSRKPQLRLAEHFGLRDFPNPGGGCLLTCPDFAVKVRDAVERGDLDEHHAVLLKTGRHFRTPAGAKVVVGKNETDNARLDALAAGGDRLLEPDAVQGPTALVLRGGSDEDLRTAVSLCGRYMKVGAGCEVVFNVFSAGKAQSGRVSGAPLRPEESEALRVSIERLSPRGKDLRRAD
jgi:tRNA-specific 2-thiouridylase